MEKKNEVTRLDSKKYSDNGLIIYRGKSCIPCHHGADIVAILTGITRKSNNRKTGDAMQLWILSDEMSPYDTTTLEGTSPICGDCPLRGKVCYVNTAKAPLTIYNCLKNGRYDTLEHATEKQLSRMSQKVVRLGAFGDPAALPPSVIHDLVPRCNGYMGFTHQWQHEYAAWLKDYCHASVDDIQEYSVAQRADWKTFRIRTSETAPAIGAETVCTNELCGTTCNHCQACKGRGGCSKVITVHGSKTKVNNFKGVK